MPKAKRVFIVADMGYNPVKMFLNATRKLAKGFIRLGHDVEIFSYSRAFRELSPLKSKTFSKSTVYRIIFHVMSQMPLASHIGMVAMLM